MKNEVLWEGITFRPLATPHASLEHYSYVVEWRGLRLYFTGDTEDTASLLAARELDVAFVSPWLLRTVQKQGRRIDARHIVVYHHRDAETVVEIQDRIVPPPGTGAEPRIAVADAEGVPSGPHLDRRVESARPTDEATRVRRPGPRLRRHHGAGVAGPSKRRHGPI